MQRVEEELVVADATEMLVEFLRREVIAEPARKAELSLTVKNEILVILQLLSEELQLTAVMCSLPPSLASSRSTQLHLLKALYYHSFSFSHRFSGRVLTACSSRRSHSKA